MSRRLLATADAIQQARTVQQLKDTYVDEARALFDAKCLGVYFLDPMDPLKPAPDREVVGIPEEVCEAYEAVGRPFDPLLQFVLHRLAAVHQRELFTDEQWQRFEPNREATKRYGAHHYLISPLIRRGAVVGTIQVARSYGQRGFERNDLSVVSALSTLLSERLTVIDLGNCTMLPENLTPRERQVVSLVIDGQTNEAVSHRLGISPNTVKFVLKNVFRKLGVSGRTQLASRLARQL